MRRALVVLLTCCISGAYADTASATDAIVSKLFAVKQLREPAISPDGTKIAWVEGTRRTSVLFMKAGAHSGRVTSSQGANEHSPAWAANGALAFLSDAAVKGQLQLYVLGPGPGVPRKLTSLKGYLARPSWSPDSRTVAVLFTENAPRAGGPTEPMTPDAGVVQSTVYEQRIALIDAATGAVRQISPADTYVHEFDWAPDGKQLVFTAAPGSGDNNWFIAKLFTIAVDGSGVREIYKPKWQIADPRWSPDGKSVAFIEGLMSDEGSTGGDIFLIPAAGGEAKDITPGRKASPSGIHWLPSSERILFTETVSGESAIATLDLSTGSSERIWKGPESLSISFSNDGTESAAVRSSWSMPPEVWAGKPGSWEQLTHLNAAMKPAWGEAESIRWTSGSAPVQGWLVKPANYDPQKRYPMVVSVHGGPASAKHPSWPGPFFDLSALSSLGYFVLFPNPRGSYGAGEDFTRANVKDFGHGDLRDILAGVDAVLAKYPVDKGRIGVGGWSYGGFMTMWTVTQTQRFRAAVAGAGISNWQSYYGENDIDQWMIPYFGASVYEDPAVYAKSSPITYIKNVKTPTLVLVGERDGECPPPQSYEFWHALKTFDVKTEFVLYPGEGHSFHDPSDIRDVLRRTLNWFNANMPAGETAPSSAGR